jgi:DNA-binding response OmpR family regulator
VIIVEDSFLLARRLADLMEQAGFVVAGLAGSPEAAIELIETREFDVALLDVMLGNRSVADVALRLHADGRPIVFLSGYNELEMLPPGERSCGGSGLSPDPDPQCKRPKGARSEP